jgi:hypothetical protein
MVSNQLSVPVKHQIAFNSVGKMFYHQTLPAKISADSLGDILVIQDRAV